MTCRVEPNTDGVDETFIQTYAATQTVHDIQPSYVYYQPHAVASPRCDRIRETVTFEDDGLSYAMAKRLPPSGLYAKFCNELSQVCC